MHGRRLQLHCPADPSCVVQIPLVVFPFYLILSYLPHNHIITLSLFHIPCPEQNQWTQRSGGPGCVEGSHSHVPCPEQNPWTCEANVQDVSKGHALTLSRSLVLTFSQLTPHASRLTPHASRSY